MLKRLELVGFKSFAKKTVLDFSAATTAIVGPNGSGKSNVAEAFRFALGEQSMKSMRGKRSEDLIFSGSHAVPRANRAAVSIVFDNVRRSFQIDFDEVVIERVVFRDGSSEYSVNGSRVRLRDIEELLAGANIGETGHHIISQGEADRILLASPRERRAMLEDALGLKLYEFKKIEAQNKLIKTEENLVQVHSLRRELAPHLRFLEKQVEKLERADALRTELIQMAQTYFAIEEIYIKTESSKIKEQKKGALVELEGVSRELAAIEERVTTDAEGVKRLQKVREAENAVESILSERSALAREIGKVEGALAAATQRSAKSATDPYAKIPRQDLIALAEEAEKQLVHSTDADAALAALRSLHTAIRAFVQRYTASENDILNDEEQTALSLEDDRRNLLVKDANFAEELEKKRYVLLRAREALTAHDETGKELRRHILELAQAKTAAEGKVAQCEGRAQQLTFLTEELERQKIEVQALVGAEASTYPSLSAVPEEPVQAQEDRKRLLERTKIRLEESGGTGDDIRHEYKEVSEREKFLSSELDDLTKSAAGLRSLIKELDTELEKHFSEGLTKVNTSFNEYFSLMFNGGSARLVLEEFDTDEEESQSVEEEVSPKPVRPGIEIVVSLPKKKVRSLIQLSGGERALTSIALIFAMSQVNPPPFLILDETDAALDEANSRRYGDIVENLAKHSQLIVITHNRETMSRAGILYGVTVGSDGVSKMLSVKFDEAAAVAK